MSFGKSLGEFRIDGLKSAHQGRGNPPSRASNCSAGPPATPSHVTPAEHHNAFESLTDLLIWRSVFQLTLRHVFFLSLDSPFVVILHFLQIKPQFSRESERFAAFLSGTLRCHLETPRACLVQDEDFCGKRLWNETRSQFCRGGPRPPDSPGSSNLSARSSPVKTGQVEPCSVSKTNNIHVVGE